MNTEQTSEKKNFLSTFHFSIIIFGKLLNNDHPIFALIEKTF